MTAAVPDTAVRVDHLLQLADTCLVLGQRLGEWVGHAPAIEEDLGLANTALDLIGQSRLLFSYVGELEGRGRDEDQLAFLRAEHEYRNLTLAEQPNGDFGQTIVRQVLIDVWQQVTYSRLCHSTDIRLAGLAAMALKETRYHLRYSGSWLVRLGDGTVESHARVQAALERLWPFTVECFESSAADAALAAAGIAPPLAELRREFDAELDPLLRAATLRRPVEAPYRWFGRRGVHSEHLGYLLAELQYLQRAHPGARW